MTARFSLLVQLPNEKFPSVRERMNSHAAAVATLREWTNILHAEGFTTSVKPKPNKKMHFRRGEEVATLHMRFTLTDTDVRRRAKAPMSLEDRLLD